MSTISKPLFGSKHAENSQTTQYTASGVRTIIDKFTGYNSTGGAVTLAINLVANAGTAGASNLCVLKSIAAGETYTFPEVVGHSLEPGGFISTIAGASSAIVIRASGREVN
ncbi:MAG: hypothetical protein KIH64_007150 [Mycobacterium sp.]|nr:hypothetical protein [Mycobacterium sp.]